jgi:hypothetical protein
MRVRSGLASLSPGRQGGKESLNTGVGRVGMKLLAGEEPHQVFGAKLHAFLPHGTPKEDECLGVEFTTSLGKLIELRVFPDADPSHLIHTLHPLSSFLTPVSHNTCSTILSILFAKKLYNPLVFFLKIYSGSFLVYVTCTSVSRVEADQFSYSHNC